MGVFAFYDSTIAETQMVSTRHLDGVRNLESKSKTETLSSTATVLVQSSTLLARKMTRPGPVGTFLMVQEPKRLGTIEKTGLNIIVLTVITSLTCLVYRIIRTPSRITLLEPSGSNGAAAMAVYRRLPQSRKSTLNRSVAAFQTCLLFYEHQPHLDLRGSLLPSHYFALRSFDDNGAAAMAVYRCQRQSRKSTLNRSVAAFQTCLLADEH
jgi:hypothetical protein